MKKVLIILGGTALVGGVAWYFLLRKKDNFSETETPSTKTPLDKLIAHQDVVIDQRMIDTANKEFNINPAVLQKVVSDPLVKITTPKPSTGTTIVNTSSPAAAKKEIISISKTQKDKVSLMGVSAYNLF